MLKACLVKAKGASTMAEDNEINQKIEEAYEAIKHLGFPIEKAKATVRRLAELYNNEWVFIEEENYRAVIDTLAKENPERDTNVLHQASSSAAVNVPNKRARLDRGKNSGFPQVAKSRSANVIPHENYTLQVFDNVLHREPMQGKVHVYDTYPADYSKYQESKPVPIEDRVNGVSNPSTLDIASCAREEVKISLICNTSGSSCFQSQFLDTVLGEVEAEFCTTYGIQDPNFSLRKLMEKVCNRFLQKNTNSRNETNNHAPHKAGGKDVKNDYQQTLTREKNIKVPKSLASSNSQWMGGVMEKKYPIYLNDISRGEERVPIPMRNEGGGALELPNFLYIKGNMVHKDAHVDFSLARISGDNCCAQCHGDCLSSALPCACAGETRGEFAYTTDGLLREEFLDECIAMIREPNRKYYYYCETCPLQNDTLRKGRRKKPCKGHLTRKFIKECWSLCGCNKKCGNRVVQRGIQVALEVFVAPDGKGLGLQSVQALKKGTFICEYIGEVVTNQELYERNEERDAKSERHTYPVLLDADWGSERILKDEEALCLDATEFGNVGRFINHRCYDANLIEIPVEIETPDHHYYHLAFFTNRDIEPMEELTWDYGIEFDDKYHPVKAFKCKCGSPNCRDKKKYC